MITSPCRFFGFVGLLLDYNIFSQFMTTDFAKPIPHVPGLPIVGNAAGLMKDAMGFLTAAYHAHGPVYQIQVPGREIIILAGPQANLLMINAGEKLFRLRPIYGKLIEETASEAYLPTLDEPEYSYYRKLIRPKMSRDTLAAYLPQAIGKIEQLSAAWQPGSQLPVLQTMTRLCLEIIAGCTENSEIGDHLADIVLFTNRLIGSGVAFQPAFLLKLPDYQSAKQRFEHFLQTIVEKHRAKTDAPYDDFVDLLLRSPKHDGAPLAANQADLLAYVHLPIVNGVAYAPRLAGYLLYELLRTPALLQKVQAEVDAAFADGVPTFHHFRHMRWLYGACMETLRRYPIAGALPRYVAEAFDFGGYRIPQGKLVFVATGVTHFLPEIYPDPYQFDPERYFEPRNEHHTPGAFAPYGLGSRTCLSAGMGESLIMIVVAALLAKYRFALPSPNYVLKTEVAPIPGPHRRFAVRVLDRR